MDAATLNCGSCGAPIPADAMQCPYCHCQVATVACPRCLGLVPVHASHCLRCGAAVKVEDHGPSGLSCPECKQPLARTSVGEHQLDQCHRCGGVWLSTELFDSIAGDREKRGEVLGSLPGEGPAGAVAMEAVHYRPCPACARFMNRVNYGRVSGVIVDTCKGHGLWFDREELRRVLEFIEKGGLDRAREHQIRELEEQKRLAAAPRPMEMGGMEDPRLQRSGVKELLGFVDSFLGGGWLN